MVDATHKTCKMTTDPQNPGAKNYRWKHTIDLLRHRAEGHLKSAKNMAGEGDLVLHNKGCLNPWMSNRRFGGQILNL